MLQSILTNLLPYIYILLPIVFIPLLMSFIAGPIMLFILKRKYLPQQLKQLESGWDDPQDKLAIEAVANFAKKRLQHKRIFKMHLKEDMNEVLFCVQKIKSKKQQDELSYSFTIKRLLYCLLLAFCDIYREYGQQPWIKPIHNLRLIWFQRALRVSNFYSQLTGLSLIRYLKETRLLGKVLRIILIPLIGAPYFIWYSLRSTFTGLFFECSFRFLYGLILMKVGYYAIYLYSEKNTIIDKRISAIPKDRLSEVTQEINGILKNHEWREKPSIAFPHALTLLQNLLGSFGILEDSLINDSWLKPMDTQEHQKKRVRFISSLKRTVTRFQRTALLVLKKQNPLYQSETSDLNSMILLSKSLAGTYYPRYKNPLLAMRLIDLLELSYMGTVIILDKVFATPGAAQLTDKISLDFIFQVKKVVQKKKVKQTGKIASRSIKVLKLANKVWRVFKIVYIPAVPYSLVFKIGNPLLMQHLQDLVREYIYQQAGRFWLYELETSIKKYNKNLQPILW